MNSNRKKVKSRAFDSPRRYIARRIRAPQDSILRLMLRRFYYYFMLIPMKVDPKRGRVASARGGGIPDARPVNSRKYYYRLRFII